MKLIPENYVEEQTITVAMIWVDDMEGGQYPCIYYDHICVAYISDRDGAIMPLDLETGPYSGGDQQADIDYLKDRGVDLKIVREKTAHEGLYIDYQVRMQND